jgi:hypothetical protein
MGEFSTEAFPPLSAASIRARGSPYRENMKQSAFDKPSLGYYKRISDIKGKMPRGVFVV